MFIKNKDLNLEDEDAERELEFGSFKHNSKNNRVKRVGQGRSEFRKMKALILRETTPLAVVTGETFFEIQGISERDKLKVATFCFDGVALSWYPWSPTENHFAHGRI